jgi:chloramphenicol 3-O phosphotransferase
VPTEDTEPGQVILLNGVSSSGKTSIAEALLGVLDRPYFHVSVDAIGAMRSTTRTNELPPDEVAAVLSRTRAGFHRVVAGMAMAGNDVVADHVLSEPWRLTDCLAVLAGIDVVLVGVTCSPEELARRERERGDRQIGQAADQLDAVHAHGRYDLVCDSTSTSPEAIAMQIKEFLDRPLTTRAFDDLRRDAARDA